MPRDKNVDRNVFHYEVETEFNSYPRLTEDFVQELLGFFAGGHTPEIRSHLLNLQAAAKKADTEAKKLSDNEF